MYNNIAMHAWHHPAVNETGAVYIQQYFSISITSCLVHIQLLYGILILHTTTSSPNTNTSPITLYFEVCKFQNFSFWIACDIPNIEVDTKEQVARHNQPNIYIHTKMDNKILRSNTHDIGRNQE